MLKVSECDFSYSCAGVDRITSRIDSASHNLSAILELLVFIHGEIGSKSNTCFNWLEVKAGMSPRVPIWHVSSRNGEAGWKLLRIFRLLYFALQACSLSNRTQCVAFLAMWRRAAPQRNAPHTV